MLLSGDPVTLILLYPSFGYADDVTKDLLEAAKNGNIKNNAGITALYIAELKALPDILRLLKDAGGIK